MFHVKHSLPRFWTTAVGERRRLLATWSAKLHEYVGTCRCWGVRQCRVFRAEHPRAKDKARMGMMFHVEHSLVEQRSTASVSPSIERI